ncbi:MAG: copper chaperone PCu(A)C [Methyloversatilis discipulorum]|uniref:copper chaperone PCu(A)C n=1 Tax=Methyloversatilis TaxID=378210 RepID=UPI0026EA74B6|nr:copper chaperone PCu(A)C [Methyloversatilis discipulorum]MBT9515635.1 copper chaperone PCu(A)C [Methyloversatilis discipulorum]
MKSILTATLLSIACSAALADVTVKDPWVRATVAEQKATGAFMQITAPKAARLVGVHSPVAGVAEIHEMSMNNNVMRMRAVPAIDLPAGKAVELKPGGYHLMLMDLRAPLVDGQTVPLSLTVEMADGRRETLEVKAPVRPLGAAASHDHH